MGEFDDTNLSFTCQNINDTVRSSGVDTWRISIRRRPPWSHDGCPGARDARTRYAIAWWTGWGVVELSSQKGVRLSISPWIHCPLLRRGLETMCVGARRAQVPFEKVCRSLGLYIYIYIYIYSDFFHWSPAGQVLTWAFTCSERCRGKSRLKDMAELSWVLGLGSFRWLVEGMWAISDHLGGPWLLGWRPLLLQASCKHFCSLPGIGSTQSLCEDTIGVTRLHEGCRG